MEWQPTIVSEKDNNNNKRSWFTNVTEVNFLFFILKMRCAEFLEWKCATTSISCLVPSLSSQSQSWIFFLNMWSPYVKFNSNTIKHV
jgi:hypothetical protein